MESRMLRSPYLVMMFMVLFCSLLYVAHSGSCDNKDVTVVQSLISTTGIPRFRVQIANTCGNGTDCAPSNIHLSCGWFASANLVNPKLFKRLEFDDCLVNSGMPLNSGQIVSFTYSNTRMYPLKFKSAEFC